MYNIEYRSGEVYIDGVRLFIPRDSQFDTVSVLFGIDPDGEPIPVNLDASGNIGTCTAASTNIIEANNEVAGFQLNGNAFSFTTSFSINKQINLVALNFSTALAKTVTVSLRDSTSGRLYRILGETAWNGTDLVLTDLIRTSSNMEIIITCTATAGVCLLYYRVEVEAI